ncbi:MAG: histidinol-phosphatase HisJ family protein [Halanaerobiaceae bacterium]|jgi:histidinol-phosphatase (PHP family)|nr:histidinol-phosphatase HisJ family protein [Halanaerobiaceae bacterium]
MYLVDYHLHPYEHGKNKNYGINIMEDFVNQAVENEIREIGFSDHDEFAHKLDWEAMEYIKNHSPIPLKIGLEIDYIPGGEEEIKNKILKYEPDYTIGSIHYINGWGFDNPAFIDEYKGRDIDQCYQEYFELLRRAVNSGLFNIIGHFDIIKIFGYRPIRINVMDIIKPVLEDVRRRDLVLEVNTNGLNKPVKEIYPSLAILEMAFQFGIPITFGSDAHEAKRVGENIKEYAALLKKTGYKEIAVFNKGEVSFKKI